MEQVSQLTRSAQIKKAAVIIEDMDSDIFSDGHKTADFSCSSSNLSNNLSNQKNNGGNSSENIAKDDSKINLVGGHINQIKIESSSILLKKTSLMEVL